MLGELERLEVGRWVIRCDAEATRRAYRAVPHGAPEDCGCDECRNFAAARHLIYTPEVLALLDRIGIDHRKEAEIYYNAPLGAGVHYYGGWFHFVGAIESGEEAWMPDGEGSGVARAESLTDTFQFELSTRLGLVPDSFEAGPVVQLDFFAKVPWVVDLPGPN